MIDALRLDLRHAWRIYRKTPWQTALAVLTMAAAMALVAGMASLWSELHLGSPSGVGKPHDLISVGSRNEQSMGTVNAALARQINTDSQTLAGLSGESFASFMDEVAIDGRPVDGHVAAVLPGYFELLEPRLRLGRGLDENDFANDGARVMVLSESFWRHHFDADPDIIGRDIPIGDHSWRIIGLLDASFGGVGGADYLFWAPYTSYFADLSSFPMPLLDNFAMWKIFGRLQPSASPQAVEAELAHLFDELPAVQRAMAPDANELLVVRGLVENPRLHREARRQVSGMLLTTMLIAVVAAVNIGIFLLARAPTRRRELALRRTVGATTRRLLAQLLVEAVVLIAAGTALGYLLSIWLAAAFAELRFLDGIEFSGQWFNPVALALLAVLAAIFTVLVAIVPALNSRAGGHSQYSARPGLFQQIAGTVQLGLAGLVGGAALALLANQWLLEREDFGLSADGIQIATLGFKAPPSGSFEPPPNEATFAFRAELRERLGSLPGVSQVSFGAPLPGQQTFAIGRYNIDGNQIDARMINAAPGFIDLLDIALLHGRDFESGAETDVIISREFAQQAWGTSDVVGRFTRSSDEHPGLPDQRVIGVIDDLRYGHPREPTIPLILSTQSGFTAFMNAVLIRGEADHQQIDAEINAALDTHLDQLKVQEIKPLSRIIAELTAHDRARARITVLFAAVIVAMASFGFFALQCFLVDIGRRETAIRMAIGAGPRSVRRHVLLRGLRLGLPGLIIAGLLALIVTAWLGDGYLLASVSAPAVAVACVLVLALLLLIASLQPALSAARLKPNDLLRED